MAIAHDGDPFDLFGEWYAGAEDCGLNEPSAVTLATALTTHATVEDALVEWDQERTATNNHLVRFGNQLGRALVQEIPDWSTMDATRMEAWFTSVVTIDTEYLPARAAKG